ncbi:hypothetical protein AB0O86_31960 [Streptomyces hirsutus]|uniref:hypothetical protein n=1 Tax=Streptomyces hirsutus TaxID=35620 RepID=UPI003417E0FE
MADQGERREPQAGGPAFGPLLQRRDDVVRQLQARRRQQRAGLGLGKAQPRAADLGQIARETQPAQPQGRIAASGEDRVRAAGKAGQKRGELFEALRRAQLMKIVEHQRDGVVGLGELRQHPVHHGAAIEAGRCGRRLRRLVQSTADHADQVEPEQLGVVSVEYRDERDWTLPTGPRSPAPQQGGLPAARGAPR